MSIASGTVASKLMGLNNTKTALSGVLADWGETVPSTFAAYPEKFDNVFTNLDAKIDAVSSCAVMISGDQSVSGKKTFRSSIDIKPVNYSTTTQYTTLSNTALSVGTERTFSDYTSAGIKYTRANKIYDLSFPRDSGTLALEEMVTSSLDGYAPSGHKHDSIWNGETAVSAYDNNAWLICPNGTTLGNPAVTGNLTAVPAYGGDTAYLNGPMEFKGPFGPFNGGEATYYVPTTSPDPTTENEAMQGQWCIYSGPGTSFGVVLIYDQNMYAEISNLNSEHPTIGSFYNASTTGSITMARPTVPVYSAKKLTTESRVGDIITTCAVRLNGYDAIYGYKTFNGTIEQSNKHDYILLHPRYDNESNDSVVSIVSRDIHEQTDYGSGGITRVKWNPQQIVYELKFPVETSGTFALEETISGKYIPYTATSGILVGNPDYSEAPGNYAIGLGSAVHANGDRSVAIGGVASALALNAVAIGATSLANSTNSLAMAGGKAYSAQSIAIGPQSQASGNFSTAIGRQAKANNNYAVAIGPNTSDAKQSITMGYKTHSYPASEYSFTWNGSTALGLSNEYAANGGGTFNINPSAGISGFYIGTKNLYTILSEQGGGATGDFLPLSGGEVSANFKLTVDRGTNFLSGGTEDVTLALGKNSVAYNGADTAIGAHCSVEGYDNTALGCWSSVGKANSSLPGPDGGAEEVALGAYSHAMGGLYCVQLGRGTNNEPYSLKVLETQTLMSKSGQSSDDLVLVCPVSGYLSLTGGEVSGDVNEEIDWPYIRMENVLLQDESDGTSNKVLVNISIEATSAELYLGKQTGDCPSPITVNTEIVGVTGNLSQFPFDIAALSGEKQVPYNTSDKFYEYTNGNSQIEIYIEPTGAISYYFVSSDDEHYYGTESIPPTETTKKISSRFITEAEIDSKIKSGGAAFDRWRKGNTIYAGMGSDHLSAGTNNSVFIGSNQTITDGKGNSVVIGSNAKSNGGSNTIIGYGAYATGTGTGNVMIGYNARNTTNQGNAVSIGYGAVSQYYGIAIGHSADANKENAVSIGWKTNCRTAKDIAIGREAQTSGGDGNFSNIAIGAWSKAFSTGGNTAITIGGGTASGNMSISLGGSVYADDAIQLGYGNNTTPNTLQYRDHKIADTAGKLYYNNTDIASMFATKNDLSDVVKTSGNQSISGEKVFANQIQVASDVNSSFNDYFGRGCVSMNSTNGSHTTFLYGAASHNFWDGSAPVLDIVDLNGQNAWVYIFPTENTYPSGGTFKLAVQEDANLIKVDNEFVDTSTATTSFVMKPEYGKYRGAVGSNGILPTFDWTNYNLSPINTNTVYHFHVSLYVNAGASTLTDPNGVNWVTGAGLPNSGFAGHWIFMSFMKENFTSTIHGSVWRVG